MNFLAFLQAIHWAAANGSVTNGGLRGVWPRFLENSEISLFGPFSAFFALFRST